MGARASRLEGSRLLVFNVVTSGLAYGAGDLIQQRMEARRKGTEVKMDLRRSSRMLAVGAPIGGMSHYWYILLDRVVSGATAGAVVRKVLADMCIFAPICLTTFFVGVGIMEGKKSREIALDLKTLLPVAYLAEWVLWPPAQAINFYIIPLRFRVLYVSSVLLIWTTILSFIKHKK